MITPDGEFIPVAKDVGHNTVFAEYINKYLGSNPPIVFNSNEAMIALVEINHIIYYGLRMRDVADIYDKNRNTEGSGFLILPKDYEETMTPEQKESTKILLDSNKSIFGNREKMKVEIHETVYGEEIEKEEFSLFLESQKEENKKI